MVLSQKLLALLVCPEDKTPVQLAGQPLIDEINGRIDRGVLTNRTGTPVRERIEGGLTRSDGRYLYPIRNGIPVMLVDEAIPLPL